MKRLAALMLALCLALCAVGTAEAVQWRDYALNAIWLTSDPADINIPNLRTDGAFALIRMQPDEGTVAYDTINTYAGDDMKLILSDGTEVPAASLMYHKLIQPEGGGFPKMDPEQDNFDLLFFLEGKDVSALEGAALQVADGDAAQRIPLADIPATLEAAPAEPEAKPTLAGTWKGPCKGPNGPFDMVVEIDENGNGIMTFLQKGNPVMMLPCSFNQSLNRLSINFKANGLDRIDADYTLSGDTLSITMDEYFTGGGKYTYTAECERQ